MIDPVRHHQENKNLNIKRKENLFKRCFHLLSQGKFFSDILQNCSQFAKVERIGQKGNFRSI